MYATRVRRRRGSNAVEFALLFPVFVWLTTGVIDYGWYFMVRTAASEAVHDGARKGAVTLKKNGPADLATSTATARLSSTGIWLKPSVKSAIGGTAPDGYITVTMTLTVTPLVGLVPVPEKLVVTTVERLEDQS